MKYVIIAVFTVFSLYSMQENHYFCSLNDSRDANDSELCMRVDAWLFACLCVEAAQEDKQDKQPFLELVSKVKNNTIDVDDTADSYVYMTLRDGMHRLLSYIRCDHNRRNCIINGKRVPLRLDMFQTAKDIKTTTLVHNKSKAYQASGVMQDPIAFSVCYAGVEISLRNPELFEQDSQSLHTVFVEFQNLLKR